MKIGLNLLVIGGFIGPADHATLKRIRDAGYDGVEIPVFSGETRDYQALAAVLDDLGLARTAVTIIPDVEHNPVSPDPSSRARARDRLHWAIAGVDRQIKELDRLRSTGVGATRGLGLLVHRHVGMSLSGLHAPRAGLTDHYGHGPPARPDRIAACTSPLPTTGRSMKVAAAPEWNTRCVALRYSPGLAKKILVA